MGLQSIKPKHREIMRRMLTCQPMEEISQELQVSVAYLGMLGRDPLFVETLGGMEGEVHGFWLKNRTRAMDVLEAHASTAAKLCTDAIGGHVTDAEGNVETVPLNKRLDSAWDVLNRTGNKAVEKKVVAHTTLQEMIISAYQQRNEALASSPGSDEVKPNVPEPKKLEEGVDAVVTDVEFTEDAGPTSMTGWQIASGAGAT